MPLLTRQQKGDAHSSPPSKPPSGPKGRTEMSTKSKACGRWPNAFRRNFLRTTPLFETETHRPLKRTDRPMNSSAERSVGGVRKGFQAAVLKANPEGSGFNQSLQLLAYLLKWLWRVPGESNSKPPSEDMVGARGNITFLTLLGASIIFFALEWASNILKLNSNTKNTC